MTNSAQHRVIFFALENGRLAFDEDDQTIVERIVETSDLAEATRMHRDCVLATGSFGAASLSPAVEAFGADDLAGYLHALNTEARLSEEHPQEGTWIGALHEDLDHWTEMGVRTPADLAAYLDGCVEREMEKARWD